MDNCTSFIYSVYGLNIESQIEFNELILSNDSPIDAFIIYGKIDEEIKKDLMNNRNVKPGMKESWVYVPNIAFFYIHDGRYIEVEICNSVSLDKVKSYLLGSIMGFLIYQKGILAIHGGAVVLDNKAAIIMGESGVGKSTLTEGLIRSGAKFLSDDISSVSFGNSIYINPGYPGRRLCKNVMEYYDYNLKYYKEIDLDYKIKYMISQEEIFVDKKVLLQAIFYLTVRDDIEKVEISEIKGTEKLEILFNNCYILNWFRFEGITNEYMKKCIRVCKEVPIYKIVRSKDGFTVDNQIEVIKDKIFKYEG